MMDHDGNINSNLNIPEDPTVENPAMGTCEVGVSSIMTSISPTLEPLYLSSDTKTARRSEERRAVLVPH